MGGVFSRRTRNLSLWTMVWFWLGWAIVVEAAGFQCDQTVFGFEKYQRTSQGTETFQDFFSVSDPNRNYALIVFNGRQGENRISRGSIRVNGVEVVTPSDFSQNVDSFENPIGALLTDNQIEVVLQRGDAGGFVVVRIVDRGSGPTSVSGVVSSTTDEPLERVTLSTGRIISLTDRDGNFRLDNVPCGKQRIRVDASSAKGRKTYASVNLLLDLEEGVDNQLNRPIYLPEIDLSNAVQVPTQVTEDILVTNPDLPGVRLRIKAGTVVTYADGQTSDLVSITEVPVDRTPRSLPSELAPTLVVTVQPESAVLSQPAEIVYPNSENLPPGSKVDLMSLSPGSGGFVSTGLGTVDPTGTSIVADPTSGLSAFDWHFWGAPPSDLDGSGRDRRNCPCRRSVGSRTDLSEGALTAEHTMPGHFSVGRRRQLTLRYNSLNALPRPILGVRSTFDSQFARPFLYSYVLLLEGVPQGPELFTDSSALSLGPPETLWQALQFDASALPTGVYGYEIRPTSFVGAANRTYSVAGRTPVVNDSAGPWGAGWSLAGLERLLPQPDGSVMAVGGDGAVSIFQNTGEGPIYDLAFLVQDPLAAAKALIGKAEGGFETPALFEGDPNQKQLLLTADFNQDDAPDLLLFSEPLSTAGELVVLLSNGDGTLSPPLRSGRTFVEGVVDAEVGDFNGDSIPDVAVVSDAGPQDLAVLLGNGDGTFRNLSRVPSEGFSTVGAVADFDNDGALDLVLHNGLDSYVRPGNGDGTFGASIAGGIGCFGGGLTAADFNGDTILDLAVVDQDLVLPFRDFDEVCVALGNGDGSFGPVARYLVGSGARAVVASDFDADSVIDLATIDYRSLQISVLPGNGDGTFGPSIATGLPEPPIKAQTLDFDSDSINDMVVSGASTIFFMRGRGDARFDLFEQTANQGGTSVVVLNLNRDARAESLLAPEGDPSRLVRNPDGTYTRTMPDQTEVRFDPSGRHTATVDRNGNATAFDYNPDGTVASITDPAGLVTYFEYLNGKISQVNDPTGRATAFSVDGSGDLVQITGPDGSTVRFEYADLAFPHLLTARIDANNSRVDYEYDFAGRFARSISESSPSPIARSLSPASTVSLVDPALGGGSMDNPVPATFLEELKTVFTDGNGNGTEYRFDGLGNPVEVTDPLGRTTRFERDENGNSIRVSRANGAEILFEVDSIGNLLSVFEPAIAATTSYSYQADTNWLLSMEDPNGNTTTIVRDAAGNATQVINPLGETTVWSYDSRGLVVAVTNAAGDTVTVAYDGLGRPTALIDPLGYLGSVTYDAAGNVSSWTEPDGSTIFFSHDLINRLTLVTEPEGDATEYGYDAVGNLTRITDARDNSWLFQYDQTGRLIGASDPLGAGESWTYDANDNPVEYFARNGDTRIFQYDAADQLILKSSPADGPTVYGYDSAGNVVLTQNQDSTLTMSYDAADRVTTVSTAGSPHQPEVVLTYAYDPAGNRISMSNNLTADVTTYTYDGSNRPVGLTALNEGYQFVYDPRGLRTSNALPNGATTNYTFNANSWLVEVSHQSAATASTYGFTMDETGHRVVQSVSRPFAGLNPTLNYEYDSAQRLARASRPFAGDPDEWYVYDESGNRVSRDGASGTAVFDAVNRLISDGGFAYTYDGGGNLVSRTDGLGNSIDYSYNSDHLLVSVEGPGYVASFRYDDLGRRIMKTVNGQITRYVYDEEDILFEFDGENAITARYAHGPSVDEPLAMLRSGTKYYYQRDGLGSVTDLLDAAGSAVQSYVYDSFGNLVGSSAPLGSPPNPYHFTGREFDSETGLYYYRARYYDPSIGRFLSEDPMSLLEGGWDNRYVYVGNDPQNLLDPTGEAAWFVAPIIGGAVAGGSDLGWQLFQNGWRWDCVDSGQVLLSGGIGSALGLMAPSGPLFGRAGATAAARGYTGGIFNRGNYRIGWSWHQGRNRFGTHGGTYRSAGHWHNTPIPGPRGHGTLEFGLGGGVFGGVIGAFLGGRADCEDCR